jgi:hypothetical protein
LELLINSSELISLGADREKIVNNLYRSRSINTLKLWGRFLARLDSDLEDRLIWSMLSQNDFEKTTTQEKDLDEVINELIINIPQASIVIIFSESKKHKNTTNIFVYSLKNINIANLVKKWENNATQNFAKVKIEKNINEAKTEVISHFNKKMKQIKELS